MRHYWIPILLPLFVGSTHAAEHEPGRQQARACAVCHGQFGLSVNPAAPNLAGQPMSYLVAQLKDYRSGRRSNPVMSVVAKPLQDEDIEALARWYSSIEIEVRER